MSATHGVSSVPRPGGSVFFFTLIALWALDHQLARRCGSLALMVHRILEQSP